MTKHSPLVEKLIALKVIPVVVVENIEDALKLGELLLKNDLPVAEITFRTAAAKEAIQALKTTYPDLYVGAGTVINPQLAKEAKDAGADFIVSPGFNIETVQACQDLGIEIIPGINNPTSIEMALNAGLTALKFFPAEASGGTTMLKAMLAPYRDILIMPTGGINEKNINDYLSIKQVIACGLSWMVDPKLIAEKNWAEIENRIQQINKIVA